ncbi:MAG: TPM domain-containing protein, partial [Leptospirales bacterium]
ALSSRIIRNEIVPQFRDGEFDAGVVAGTRAILQAIQGEYTIDESDGAQSETGESGPGHTIGEWVSKIFTFLFAAAFLLYAAFMGFGFLIALVQLGLFGESPVLFIFIGPFIALFALIPLLLLWDAAPTLPVYLAMLALLSGFKILLHTTRPGRDLRERFKPSASRSGSSASSAGGWSGSSSSTYSSSSSGGFSGGGGSFGGGGASGSW